MGCKISELLRREWILAEVKAVTRDEVLREIAHHLAASGAQVDPDELVKGLVERENKASTGVDQGLAIPHATVRSAEKLVVALGRSTTGIDFGALDGQRSSFFFTIVSPARPLTSGEVSYLQAISAICKLMRSTSLRQRLLAAPDAAAIHALLVDEEQTRDSRNAVAV